MKNKQFLRVALVALLTGLIMTGCSTKPLVPYTTETIPLMLVPALKNEAQDKRGRFREIFCSVLEARKASVHDYRNCDEAITPVGNIPEGSGQAVNLGPAQRNLKVLFVPGVGWDCFSNWLAVDGSISNHLKQFGYDMVRLNINGLASCEINAQKIRDAILAMPQDAAQSDLVLVGYSKGAPDVLTAIVNYPEIHPRLLAVVSIAGAIGGSPLANDINEGELNLMQHFPGATCTPAGEGALKELRPHTRQEWLARYNLPAGISYYSIITFPEPGNISSILQASYRKLSRVDARNDSQLIFYDQFIPDSMLLAYLNADHWAVATPIARTHGMLGEFLADRNNFPREALFEALLRFIEEETDRSGHDSVLYSREKLR